MENGSRPRYSRRLPLAGELLRSGAECPQQRLRDRPRSSRCRSSDRRRSRSARARACVLVKNASSAPNRSSSRSTASRTGTPTSGADLEQELARDPRQQPGVDRRRQRRAVLDDEQVRLRALGELAAIVAHHAFEARRAGSASCIASALFIRLLDLISGLTELGMVADDVDERRRVTPRSIRLGGGSTCGLTMTTTDGVGRGGGIVGELADAAGDEDADVGLAIRRSPRPARASSRGTARRSRRRSAAPAAPACRPTCAAAACGDRTETAGRCRCAASRRCLRRRENRGRRPR